MYSSALTTDSQIYSRTCRISNYYYETIQVNAASTGVYSLSGTSRVGIYGYIYKDNFNPLNPFENLCSENGVNCGDRQFMLTTILETGTTYILVVTTFSPNDTGNFSIFVSGPNNISLNHISEYLYCLLNNQLESIKYRKCL